jgi:hypothetical protein
VPDPDGLPTAEEVRQRERAHQDAIRLIGSARAHDASTYWATLAERRSDDERSELLISLVLAASVLMSALQNHLDITDEDLLEELLGQIELLGTF